MRSQLLDTSHQVLQWFAARSSDSSDEPNDLGVFAGLSDHPKAMICKWQEREWQMASRAVEE